MTIRKEYIEMPPFINEVAVRTDEGIVLYVNVNAQEGEHYIIDMGGNENVINQMSRLWEGNIN